MLLSITNASAVVASLNLFLKFSSWSLSTILFFTSIFLIVCSNSNFTLSCNCNNWLFKFAQLNNNAVAFFSVINILCTGAFIFSSNTSLSSSLCTLAAVFKIAS
jgi:hypothetical protein